MTIEIKYIWHPEQEFSQEYAELHTVLNDSYNKGHLWHYVDAMLSLLPIGKIVDIYKNPEVGLIIEGRKKKLSPQELEKIVDIFQSAFTKLND